MARGLRRSSVVNVFACAVLAVVATFPAEPVSAAEAYSVSRLEAVTQACKRILETALGLKTKTFRTKVVEAVLQNPYALRELIRSGKSALPDSSHARFKMLADQELSRMRSELEAAAPKILADIRSAKSSWSEQDNTAMADFVSKALQRLKAADSSGKLTYFELHEAVLRYVFSMDVLSGKRHYLVEQRVSEAMMKVRDIASKGIYIVPTGEPLSMSDFNRAFEGGIMFAGVVATPQVADGVKRTPSEFYLHDVTHAEILAERFQENAGLEEFQRLVKRMNQNIAMKVTDPRRRAACEAMAFAFYHEYRLRFTGQGSFREFLFQVVNGTTRDRPLFDPLSTAIYVFKHNGMDSSDKRIKTVAEEMLASALH